MVILYDLVWFYMEVSPAGKIYALSFNDLNNALMLHCVLAMTTLILGMRPISGFILTLKD